MTAFQKTSLVLLRLGMGWLFFYAGITKILDPKWSAAFYIKDAKMFRGFYDFLLTPNVLPVVNFLNEWGLTLIGASLILGILVRYSAPLGTLLMLLYYFPILQFPYPNPHSYIVDEHIIYALVLIYLALARAGTVWGLERR